MLRADPNDTSSAFATGRLHYDSGGRTRRGSENWHGNLQTDVLRRPSLTVGLAMELAGPMPDGLTRLTAGMIVLTLRTAREEGTRQIERGASTKKANLAFLTLTERGLGAVEQLLATAPFLGISVDQRLMIE